MFIILLKNISFPLFWLFWRNLTVLCVQLCLAALGLRSFPGSENPWLKIVQKISVTLITLHVMLIKNVKIQFVSLNYKSSSSRRSSTCRASYYYWPFLKCRFSLSDAVKILNLLLCSINLLQYHGFTKLDQI